MTTQDARSAYIVLLTEEAKWTAEHSRKSTE